MLLVVVCVASAYAVTYHPVYDDAGEWGDETMTLSQAFNAVTAGVPGYGYTGTGQLWTASFFSPLYVCLYGPVASRVPPLERIPAARQVSRLLLGLSLFVAMVTVLPRGAGWAAGDRTWFDLTALALSVAILLFLFLVAEPFAQVGSSARIDVLGLLCITIFAWAAAKFLARPHEIRLGLLGLVVALALFSNPLAAVVSASELTVIGLAYLLSRFSLQRLARCVAAALVVVTVAGTSLLIVHHVTPTPPLPTAHNVTFRAELTTIKARLMGHDLTRIAAEMRSFPGLLPAATAAGCAASFLWILAVRRRGVSQLPVPAGLLAARLAAVTLAMHCFFVYPRAVYAPMLLMAVLLPSLAALNRSREFAGIRCALAAAVLVLMLLSVPTWVVPRARRADGVWIALNAIHDQHLESLFAFLGRNGVQSAFATDPLFTLLDGPDLRFFFVNEYALAADRELAALRYFGRRFGTTYVIDNELGNTFFAHTIGMLRLREALHKGLPSVVYPDGATFRIERIFETAAEERLGVGEYTYVPGLPSTPFRVYRLVEYEPVRQ